MLDHLKLHLAGKAIVMGVGNTLRSDDGFGSLLAQRLKDKVPFAIFDAGVSPENYLEKIIKEKPDNLVIIDAADFGGKPGELRVLEAEEVRAANLFSTHNASISLTINYLQSNIKVDIIVLVVQPKTIRFGDQLSPEIERSLEQMEIWFHEAGKN